MQPVRAMGHDPSRDTENGGSSKPDQRYRYLFEHADDLVFTLDLDGNLTAINAAAERVSGYRLEEGKPLHLSAIVAPEYAAITEHILRDRLSGVLGTRYELEIVCRSGERVPLEMSAQLVREDNRPIGIQGIARDIRERRLADNALRESEERFRGAFDAAAIGMAIVGLDGRWLEVNLSLCAMLGYSEAELLRSSFQAITHPDDLDTDLALVEQMLKGTIQSYHLEKRYIHREGHTVWGLLSVSLVHGPDRTPHYFVSQIQDVTERKRVEEALGRERELLHALMDNLPDSIYFKDAKSRFIRINRAVADLFGLDDPSDAIGKTDFDFFTEEHARAALLDEREILRTAKPIVGRVEREALPGRPDRWILTTKMPLFGPDYRPAGTFGISRDITELKIAEAALAHRALHDALTDLPNRSLLRERLHESISTADDEGSTLGLLFLDLNRFKDINDTYGHQYGDAVLQTLAARLDALLGESGMLARLGGDEFAILLPRTGEKEAILAAQRIVSALGEPFMVDGRVFDVGASVGIAVYPAQARDASELMRRADIAMYAAKRGGDGFVVYRPEMEQTNPVRLSLARELRTAIASNQLTLSYQPQVQISTGCADHVEALVRWRHPERGFMPPSTFIPLAEEMGLIGPLTTWVLSEAARQLDAWRDQGLEIRVAVNLSARSLHDPDLVRTVQDCLAAFNVSPSALALEITESAIIIDPDRAMTTARQLHDMGVRLSIDDFGTGYSSLAYLKRLPIDEVKIDRSFVTDVESNADNAFIVRSLIDLAHNLGIQVVGEGVEDPLALAFLQTHGCELAQGYYLSRPLTPERYSAWLAERAT